MTSPIAGALESGGVLDLSRVALINNVPMLLFDPAIQHIAVRGIVALEVPLYATSGRLRNGGCAPELTDMTSSIVSLLQAVRPRTTGLALCCLVAALGHVHQAR